MNFKEKTQHKSNEKSYLIRQLEKGDRKLKILFMSHNAYWSYLQGLDMRYDNCSADVTGRGTAYIGLRNINTDDDDLILYYSSTFYEDDELQKMSEIASAIAKNKNKRVSIGYSYVIPMEDRKNKDISKEIKIVSFKGSNVYEETVNGFEFFSCSDLIDMTLVAHDKLNQRTDN